MRAHPRAQPGEGRPADAAPAVTGPRADSLLVEFLGVPGAGKSALSSRLAGRLQRLPIPVHQPSRALAHDLGRLSRAARKSVHVALEAGLHPLASARAARVLASSGQPSAACAAGLLFNWLLVISLARRARRRPGLHLLDEGLAQVAWAIALEGRVESALQLLGQLPPGTAPDLVVTVHASLEAIAARLRSRPQQDSRLDLRLDTEPELLQRGATTAGRIETAVRSVIPPERGLPGSIGCENEAPGDLDARAAELSRLLEDAARESGWLARSAVLPSAVP